MKRIGDFSLRVALRCWRCSRHMRATPSATSLNYNGLICESGPQPLLSSLRHLADCSVGKRSVAISLFRLLPAPTFCLCQ
jgi:hypothetical protein